MKKVIIFSLFLLMFSSNALSQVLQSESISNLNISVFDASSDGRPTDSFENGSLTLRLVIMEGYYAGKAPTLFIEFYDSARQNIASYAIDNKAQYIHRDFLEQDEVGFSCTDVNYFKKTFSDNSSISFMIYILRDKQEISGQPLAIRFQFHKNDKLKISAAAKYTDMDWQNIMSVLKRFCPSL